MTSFEEILARDGSLVYKTRGRSMEPLLRQDRDLVVINALSSRLNENDVALYKRGDKYVLHRVIKVMPDHYLIRGDNTFTLEKVPDSAVLGVMTAFKRKGREHKITDRSYQRYVRFWNAIYPLRHLFFHFKRVLISPARKTGLLPVVKKLIRRK